MIRQGQDRDEIGTRQGQDRDKTGTRQGQDKDKILRKGKDCAVCHKVHKWRGVGGSY